MTTSERYDDRTPVTTVVVGLGFGDEGKGMAVAHETGRALFHGLNPVNVRFNGGPQAAHNVRVVKDGKVLHHTFSQFGSGSILGVETILTKGMLFDPTSIACEATHLSKTVWADVMPWLHVDERCPVVLPLHVRANRIIESGRGDRRHGSTGNGIGVARTCEHLGMHAVTVRTLLYPESLRMRMMFWRDWVEGEFGIDLGMTDEDVSAESRWLSDGMKELVGYGIDVVEDASQLVRDCVSGGGVAVFEGSQGMLLDERYGWFPHVTYGDMTPKAALDIIGDAPHKVIGVTRSYQTRHGAGPFPSECTYEASETDNGYHEWAGSFRTGLLDMPTLFRTSMEAGVDEVAISHMDRYPGVYISGWMRRKRMARSANGVPSGPILMMEPDGDEFIGEVERWCSAPVTVLGSGPTTDDWKDKS